MKKFIWETGSFTAPNSLVNLGNVEFDDHVLVSCSRMEWKVEGVGLDEIANEELW